MTVLNSWPTPVVDGDIPAEDFWNDMGAILLTQMGLNNIRQLIDRAGVWSAGSIDGWGDAYIDDSGRDNSVDHYNTTFDTNQMEAVTSSTEPFVIIAATSISAISDFEINNCKIVNIASGEWQLSCYTGTDEVKRAQIYKTLFFGSDGTDARASSTYITSITELRTNITRDIGKQAHYAYLTYPGNAADLRADITYTGTFVNTSTNTDCSAWSNLLEDDVASPFIELNFPGGTQVNISNGDEIGTDTSADEDDNPATLDLNLEDHSNVNSDSLLTGHVVVLCVGDITWAYDETILEGAAVGAYSEIDFLTDNSIPIMTSATTEDFISIIYHTIPTGTFSDTTSKVIGVPLISDWETGANIQYKLTGSGEDSGWLTCGVTPIISAFTAFASEPTALIIRLTPKSSAPTTNYPAIKGFWILAK